MTCVVSWVEASAADGLGHAARGAAVVGAAAERGWSARMVVDGDVDLARSVVGGNIAVEPAGQSTADPLTTEDVVVFDGYRFSDQLLEDVGERAGAVALVDDTAASSRPVDVIVCADIDEPWVGAGEVILTGWRHALLRRGLNETARSPSPRTGPLLLTFGGSDPSGLGPRVIHALASLGSEPEPTLLLQGPAAAPFEDSVPSWLEIVVAPADVMTVLSRAGSAITAGGVTALELAVLGVPMAVIATVPDQQATVDRLSLAGGCIPIDISHLEDGVRLATETFADPVRAGRLARAAGGLVDGKGADRVLDVLDGIRSGPK